MSSPCDCVSTARRCSWAVAPTLHFAVPGVRINIMSTKAARNPRGKRTNEGAVAAAGVDIPLLPFPGRRILPCEQILISSVSVQNPPVLLPPKSVCPLPICPSRRCRSQPLPGVSRKQRYNTLDFPRESRVPTGMLLAPIGNPEPRGYSPLDIPCFHRLCIYKPALACIYHNP